ncbi:AAA family ATPase [Mucilaginibacter sp. 21P]|uniref:ATP-dependent nuclease n=1 Tax=Mucilaginibacter sp. 21P TaxID=2778902 RepID=UPI001C5746B4|nr:TOPRIM nucleotidyl transferase/hydrolase domain-containing protein [Mucilaginibacter sp. 21P]QXV63995.1 AAA family ATPase [Mucilaginibacter sp. 21P]
MRNIIQVRLQNFKRFDEFVIDFKPDVNVLIGDNETGKSSILLAIDLVLSGSRTKVENIGLQSLFNSEAVATFLSGKKLVGDLPELIVDVYLTEQENYELNGKVNLREVSCDGMRMVCKPDPDYGQEILSVLRQERPNFPFEFYQVHFQTFDGRAYSSHRNYVNHVFIDNSQINNEYAMREYIRSVYRINASGSEKNLHQNEYRRYKSDFKSNVLKDINKRLPDFAFAVKSGIKDSLETDLTLMEGDISIDNKGKGRQCFIKTKFALGRANEKMDIVLLEEPENHLSHHHMKLLIDMIRAAKQIQLFITTHNTLVSTRLDLRRSILIHVNSKQPMLLEHLREETAKFFIKAPDNNVVEYILSQKVILVEGDAEYMLMSEFYEEVTKSTLDADLVHVISVGGISFKRYLDVAKILGIKTAVIRDNDGDYDTHCVDNYSEYPDPYLRIFGEKDNTLRTFEYILYTMNKSICDELFSTKRKKLTVLEYMLCQKSETAYQLIEQKPGQIKTPGYIKEAIEWLRL